MFDHYENCGDEEDEGYDLDTLIAIAEAEDSDEFEDDLEDEVKYDPEKIDSEVEALEGDLEDPSELGLEMELAHNVSMSQENTYQTLSKLFSPTYIQEMATIWKKREKELSKLKLPFWN